jgi:hypothetical protein
MTKQMTVKDYIYWCDKNDPKAGLDISNYLIDFFIMCNPHRKDMSRKDWLDIIIEDYVIIFGRDEMTIEPIKSEFNKEFVIL